ncbi:MAG: valine--tRNA ligase [Nanoarchaeota archaeon]
MGKNKTNFNEIEKKWKEYWEKEEIYKFNPNSKKTIYSIDTPPPYISGRMHIGHAFSYSQQDFIIRYMRMKGKNIFYPFGTDDNGLPTERFIEKINKIKSRKMGRTEFIKICQETLKKETPGCIQDFKDLGISSDYDIYYSTIDNHSQKVSQESFINLYKQGDIYKKEFPTIWCSECQTSIAQAELEDKESTSLFSTLKFKISESEDILPIATTRPELLPACVAVFINPEDKRYKKFIGKKAIIPLFDYEVPILEDKSAEIDKGTGILMVCSYGDKYDVEAINRHKLSPRIVLTPEGKLNELSKNYQNLKIKKARKEILEDLKKENLIIEQKQISHVVNCHDKCGNEIEFIPTEQWFIKILNNKEKWIELGRKINWYPDYMRKRYENWVKGLEWDWNISRNRHFGVPIPVWTCSNCNEIILPEKNELPVDPLKIEKQCSRCKQKAIPESRVLDTWATSSLTPQIAYKLPQAKNKAKIPFLLRPNAHDIIRTWAFYTIVKSWLHEKKLPWKDIIVSGIVSLGGEKMSKSKGNVVNPIEVMNNHGADALRFWASSSKLGGDLDYHEQDLVAGKKFITKLQNASRFVFMNLEDYNPEKQARPKTLQLLDEIFLKKINFLIKSATESFEKYEYSKVKSEVEQFFWNDFCDNYLEIVKKRIYQGKKGSNEKISAQYTLYNSLLAIIKMLAPIMPFITEEIYQTYFKEKAEKEKSIHLSQWPESKPISKDEQKDNLWEIFKDTLSKIRQEKTNNSKAMNSEIILTLNKENYQRLEDVLQDLKNVTNSREIKSGKFNVEFL